LTRETEILPGILFEDDHLLVVNKPPGWNTHAPGPYAGEGLYDWLRHREPRWASLAIIHRLDKETSGLLVFAKTVPANRSLTGQFTQRTAAKRYLLLTDAAGPHHPLLVKSCLARLGERYASRPVHAGAPVAETRFQRLGLAAGHTLVEAAPLTGRTHQIRVQAADAGFSVLGDRLYGGKPAVRVCLHAAALHLRHPATQQLMQFEAAVDWEADPRLARREAIIDPGATDAFRLVHGAADDAPGWFVDRLGDFLLSHAAAPLSAAHRELLTAWQVRLRSRGAYHRLLEPRARCAASEGLSPVHVQGERADDEILVRENGVTFALRFNEGYGVGLFLDQRDNRRRLLANHVAAGFPAFGVTPGQATVLNLFAYTCGFSVCAALAGARTTNVDLSRKHLDWGKRNFALNGLDASAHEFLAGEAFGWLRRLARKGRRFDVVLLDPPTFSTSKEGGRFSAERDLARLVSAAIVLLRGQGVLFASTNAGGYAPQRFVQDVRAAIERAGWRVLRQHYVPQPPDFPITREQPAHLKTVWLRLSASQR